MTTGDVKKMIMSKLHLMDAAERADFILELYTMDLVDREDARRLLGISEDEYLERAMFGAWFTTLEERFEELPDELISRKHMEIVKEYGEY